MHWTIIEVGSKQPYIFSSNKQRLQVAASAAIWSLGCERVRKAIESAGCDRVPDRELRKFLDDPDAQSDGRPRVGHVVETSGKAVLLVPTKQAGIDIVEILTREAIEDNSGLDVWGYVSERLADDLSDAGTVFHLAELGREQHRLRRLGPQHRDATLPFHEPCAYTPRPAIVREVETSEDPTAERQARSASVDYLFRRATEARRRMIETLKTLDPEAWTVVRQLILDLPNMKKGLSDNGWVGVLHADGNGLGTIFTNLRHIYTGRDFISKENALSRSLDEVSWQALLHTVRGVHLDGSFASDAGIDGVAADEPTERWARNPKEFANTILPIVVGGDDFALAVSGAIAFDFAVLLAQNFTRLASGSLGQVFTDALAELHKHEIPVPGSLSLAVGLAFTKPHHPFTHGFHLAGQLEKAAKERSRDTSIIDAIVLRESTVRDLGDIKRQRTISVGDPSRDIYSFKSRPLDVDGSPFALSAVDHVRLLIRELNATDEDTGERALPRGRIQVIRDALTEVGSGDVRQVRSAIESAQARHAYQGVQFPELLQEELDSLVAQLRAAEQAAATDSANTTVVTTDIVTAIDLADVMRGTEHGNSDSQPAEAVPGGGS